MILPIITCLEGACVAGVVWRPDLLAAFLAWWMPLNLLLYLAVALLAVCQGASPHEKATSLWRLLWVTVGFIPYIAHMYAYLTIRNLLRKYTCK